MAILLPGVVQPTGCMQTRAERCEWRMRMQNVCFTGPERGWLLHPCTLLRATGVTGEEGCAAALTAKMTFMPSWQFMALVTT